MSPGLPSGPRRVHLGISPCPNDTYAFHGLLCGAVRAEGLALEIELADIETLNAGYAAGRFDAAKASFAAALRWGADSVVLRAGSALGFGVGPLLLARRGAPPLDAPGAAPRVLCPGERTTAHLLYRLFHPRSGQVEHVVYARILPALARGEADYGVCIHESRFTYARLGLELVEDLGASWEARENAPLPLGGIVARRALGAGVHGALDAAIRASLDHARADPAGALATMRRHAVELDDAVIRAHVELYVNAWTRDLGARGSAAIRALARAARAAGLAPDHLPELELAPAAAPDSAP